MKRVLIVEDDAPIREGVVELLTGEGYLTSEAQDGLEALRLAREHRPDLILLDLLMPAVTGWEFLAEHARDPTLTPIPVIVISALSPERLHEVEQVAEVISKPFELDTLLEAVARRLATSWDGPCAAHQESG